MVFEAHRFAIENDILYHLHQHSVKRADITKGLIKQVVLPKGLRKDILESYHDHTGGHARIDRLVLSIMQKWY